MGRQVMALVVLLGMLTPSGAEAQRCDGAQRWAEACQDADVEVRVRDCLPGGVIVSTSVGGEATLDVEIARDRPGAFREVGDLGVSPIGEFADWGDAPPRVRQAFDVVVACIEADPSLDVPEGQLVPGGREAEPSAPPVPWLLWGALFVAFVAAGYRFARARPTLRHLAWSAAPVVLFAILAYVVRAAMTDPSFVHQNGQGPLWVSHALCITPVYGPGYFEVFGRAVAMLGGEPSAALFSAQAALASLAASAVWLIARGASVRPLIAGALTLAVVCEPALARIAQSESYFGAIASLLLIASAILSVGARRRRWNDPEFLLCVVAAGLIVAQAARIHPVAWVPSAMLPLVIAVGRGRVRTRLTNAAVATAGIGLLATIFAASVIGDVTGGGVGDQWLPDLLSRIPRSRISWGLSLGAGGGVAIALAGRYRRQAIVRGLAFFLVVAIAFCSHLIGAVGPIIVTAYLLLFLPAFIAVLGAGIDGAARRRAHVLGATAALLVFALSYGAFRADGLLTLPTDAREQAWILGQRSELASDASVAFLGSAGPRRRLHLPLYGECGAGGASAVQLSTDTTIRDLDMIPTPVVWYRSSLCTTDDGRAYCDAMEARYRLTPIAGADLPALLSMDGLGYEDGTVHVGLYAVEGRR